MRKEFDKNISYFNFEALKKRKDKHTFKYTILVNFMRIKMIDEKQLIKQKLKRPSLLLSKLYIL